MATLTLFTGGRVLQVYRLTASTLLIGSNRRCDIALEHAQVGDRHAEIRSQSGHFKVTALSKRFPLVINHQAVESKVLENGDTLQIGDYTLAFAEGGKSTEVSGEEMLNELMQSIGALPSGHVQILNGASVGRIIQLNRSLTRMGASGHECAVIAHRKSGYFLSQLEGKMPVKVNGREIGDHTVHLKDGDTLQIENTRMRFHEQEQ